MNGRNTPEGLARHVPHAEVRDNNVLNNGIISHQYVSMINLPVMSSAPLKTSTPIPLPRKNSTPVIMNASHRKSLSHINTARKDSNSSNTSSSDTTPQSAVTAKSWRSIDTNSAVSKQSTPESINGHSNHSTQSSVRCNGKRLNTNGAASELTKPAETQKSEAKINQMSSNTSSPQPKTNNSDNNANDTSKCDPSEPKEKRTDNSIWYEYGCV